MTIQDVRCDHYRIPLPVTLSDSTHGEITHFELITARIRDSDGAEGMGYTVTVGAGGSAVRALMQDDMAPLLIGEEADRIEHLWKRLWWGLHYVGREGVWAYSAAALDIALWDLKGRVLGTPLWRLLGGHDPEVRVYAGGIDLLFPIDQLLAQTQDNLDAGFRAIKMKVGRDRLQEDVERVAEMRRFLGDDFPLMVDANMRWRVDEGIRASRALGEHNLYWLEEPTIPDDYAGFARIVAEGSCPIATGENLRTLHQFQTLISAHGVDFPEPDVSNCGGITPWLKIAHLAEAHNLPLTTHGLHDVQVHLLAAIPNANYLEAHGFGLDRFIAAPLQIVDGLATAPERAGHGIELDWAALERLRV